MHMQWVLRGPEASLRRSSSARRLSHRDRGLTLPVGPRLGTLTRFPFDSSLSILWSTLAALTWTLAEMFLCLTDFSILLDFGGPEAFHSRRESQASPAEVWRPRVECFFDKQMDVSKPNARLLYEPPI